MFGLARVMINQSNQSIDRVASNGKTRSEVPSVRFFSFVDERCMHDFGCNCDGRRAGHSVLGLSGAAGIP